MYTCLTCDSDLERCTCPTCDGVGVERSTNWTCGECYGAGSIYECVVCHPEMRERITIETEI